MRGLRLGEHGLPLIGSGDWNDGMNLVGEHGKAIPLIDDRQEHSVEVRIPGSRTALL
jgi:hypothetical protein